MQLIEEKLSYRFHLHFAVVCGDTIAKIDLKISADETK